MAPAKKTDAAPAEHPTGLDKSTREKIVELIDEWEGQGIRHLPFVEWLREKVADVEEPAEEPAAD